MATIVDATVLSNFAAIRRLDLLHAAVGSAYVASAVFEEIQHGAESRHAFLAAINSALQLPPGERWLRLTELEPEEAHRVERMPRSLHRGEAASLAIALQRGWQLFTDDRAARAFARANGLEIGGTRGVLLELIERQYLTVEQANGHLHEMIERAGYYSPVDDLRLL